MDRLTHKLDKWDRYKQQVTSTWSVATSISTSSVDKYDPDQLKEDILKAKQRVTRTLIILTKFINQEIHVYLSISAKLVIQ